ncbi:TauD/TfdA family dioxygenase [Novosphingobium sp. CF614]|uniref:TauD/TfdA dioxygenase family protein n=1 Tax=Novosphingobium sp. CF614 TaxID=1884364 RepID=UPI0015A6F7A7|nr:TauD/TfdA family dioxygenase [Novosphingobium sp. CF614]
MVSCQIRNLSAGFGAEVIGLETTGEIDAETRQALRKAFDERGALLFRKLDIDFAGQDRLCRMLIGDETPGSTETRKENHVSNKEDDGLAPSGRLMFHADMMWHEKPFQVLSLYAINVEPGSATTSLTSTEYAWRTLPEDLRKRIEGKHARHQTGQVYHRGGDDLLMPQRSVEQSTVKAIPEIHPRTGKPLLYVSQQMTHNIVELPEDESEELLLKVFDHLYAPDMVYEHEWQNGDLLVFDNIAMQHARGNVERDGPTRTLRKVIAPIPNIKAEAPRYAKA